MLGRRGRLSVRLTQGGCWLHALYSADPFRRRL